MVSCGGEKNENDDETDLLGAISGIASVMPPKCRYRPDKLINSPGIFGGTRTLLTFFLNTNPKSGDSKTQACFVELKVELAPAQHNLTALLSLR